jgi:rubrerythrin
MTDICGWLKAQIKDEEEAHEMYLRKNDEVPQLLVSEILISIAVDEKKHSNLLKGIAQQLDCHRPQSER